MLIGIDHGNKQIKSRTRIFTSGLCESDTRPSERTFCFIPGNTIHCLTSASPICGIRPKTNGPLFSHCLPLPLNLKMQGIRQRRSSTYSSESGFLRRTTAQSTRNTFSDAAFWIFGWTADPMPCLSVRSSAPRRPKAKWFAGAALNTSDQSMASVMSTALSRLNAFLDTELEHLLCFDKKSFRAYTTRDNKDIFISTFLIVEAIRYFLSAVRTFL